MQESHYLLYKAMHILGVVVFVGNIVVSAWWKTMADRSLNPLIIKFAQRQITLTDYVFTAGGAALLYIGGLLMSMQSGLNDIDTAPAWYIYGHLLFIISGIIWLFVLIPVQYKQAKLTQTFEANSDIPKQYFKLGQIWMIAGLIATILPLISLFTMTLKPI